LFGLNGFDLVDFIGVTPGMKLGFSFKGLVFFGLFVGGNF
jgi:hypothetical protein